MRRGWCGSCCKFACTISPHLLRFPFSLTHTLSLVPYSLDWGVCVLFEQLLSPLSEAEWQLWEGVVRQKSLKDLYYWGGSKSRLLREAACPFLRCGPGKSGKEQGGGQQRELGLGACVRELRARVRASLCVSGCKYVMLQWDPLSLPQWTSGGGQGCRFWVEQHQICGSMPGEID